jgi:hypothetical protein
VVKVEEGLEKNRAFMDKVERKIKEVVEQNVSIKIQADSMKIKQSMLEKQFTQLTTAL